MKTALLGVAFSLLPTVAYADETWDKTHCDTAFQVDDWPSVTEFCKSAAEDKGVDALNASGDAEAIDFLDEGVYLGYVGMAYDKMNDSASSEDAYAAARSAVTKAVQDAKTQQTLELAQKVLSGFPPG
jgi:hypothetical protein